MLTATQAAARSNDRTPFITKRTAINSSGRLGSLYDGYHDCILGQVNVNTRENTCDRNDKINCLVTHGSANQRENILKTIGVDSELRLNRLLNLAATTSNGIVNILDYPLPINDYTRFFYFAYLDREEHLSDNPKYLAHSGETSTTATHIITGIQTGIELIVVLQLVTDAQAVTAVDNLLQRMRSFLQQKGRTFCFGKDEQNTLQNIIQLKVYSNVKNLASMTTLPDICHYVTEARNSTIDYPMLYTLRSIDWLQSGDTHFNPLPQALIDYMEDHVLQQKERIDELKKSINNDLPRLLDRNLQEKFFDVQKRLLNLEEKYANEIQRLAKLVMNIRCGQKAPTTNEVFNNPEQIALKEKISDLNRDVQDLKAKGHCLKDLARQGIGYRNVIAHNMSTEDNAKTIERKLASSSDQNRILCSNKAYPQDIERQRLSLIEEQRRNFKLRPAHVDFSYGPFMTRLPSKTIVSSNILLMGETGVGKSTFINAFVNYLRFGSLQQAQASKPVVLIPVSFVVTVDETFEERLVTFGNVNHSDNEDFHHPGQSVTQRCQSYLFHLNGHQLRIIDTPGFGDTRGLDQDDRNMQHVLEYISNLTHLDAICFLLKPNASRLHVFFRSCVTQLFSFLTTNALNNMIFCFTNTRSTFYTPGDTAPLLKKMLASLSLGDEVPFNKENTFCFDNEAFRYLVALQNKITFGDTEKDEYQRSWSTSVTQSNRLLEYIRTKLTTYHLHDDLPSIKNAQLEILRMVRPMLETMRNLLCIEVHPKVFAHETMIHPIDQDELILLSSSTYDKNRMTEMLGQLCDASARFSYFLTNNARCCTGDPFMAGLLRMIEKETTTDLNCELVKELNKFKANYEQRMIAMKSKKDLDDVSVIFERIRNIREYPMIRKQISVIQEEQKLTMKQSEHEVTEI